jgi:Domain of unknown function (DUF4149)
MLALRYVALVALATWLGGLVAIGLVAAPAVFTVTAARHAPDARLLAGAIVGEILRRFEPVSWTAGAVLLLTLIARAVLGPRPRRLAWRATLATLMLAASVYAGLVVTRGLERLQAGIGVAPSSLPPDDPRRVQFGRLHGLASGLQLVPLLGGLVLMYWELRE